MIELSADGTEVQWAHTTGVGDSGMQYDLAHPIGFKAPEGMTVVLVNKGNRIVHDTGLNEVSDVHQYLVDVGDQDGRGFASMFYMTSYGHAWDYWKSTYVAKAGEDGDGDGVADNLDVFPNDVIELSADGTEIQWAHTTGINNSGMRYDMAHPIGFKAPAGMTVVLVNKGEEIVHDTGLNEVSDVHQYLVDVGDQDDRGLAAMFYMSITTLWIAGSDGGGELPHVWDYWPSTYVAKAGADGDGDGVVDDVDVFPNDASEWGDKDGDGVGDNSDAFPMDELETVDADGDGFGANIDQDDFNKDVKALSFAELSADGTEVRWAHTTGINNSGMRYDMAHPIGFKAPAGMTVVLVSKGGGVEGAVHDTGLNEVSDVHKYLVDVGDQDGRGLAAMFYMSITTFKVAGSNGDGELPHVWDYWQRTFVAKAVIREGLRLSLSALNHNYDGNEKNVTVTTEPSGLNVVVTYTDSEGSAVANPTNAGTYTVTATIWDDNYDGPAIEGSTSGSLKIFPAGYEWETESEVTSLYRANSNDLYVRGTFASGTPEVNTFAPGDRVIIILSKEDEKTFGYKLDGVVFRVKAPDSGFMMLTPVDTEITDIQMPGGLKLSSPRGTMVYMVGNDYVGDTADSDGDKVPDTWDVFPSDASESYDSDGDGLGDNSDSFPLDSTKTAPTNALVTPTNEISLYYTANDHAEGGKKDIYVHAKGMPNLEVLSDGSYKVLGSYVKLVVTDSAITDASVKFDGEVFKVTSASGQSNNQGYILHIEPASGASLADFDSVRPASGTARWEYVNYMPNGLRLSLSGLSHVYDGNEKEVTVTTEPTGLNVGVTYTDSEGSAVANPTNAGTYTVTATIDDGNYDGPAIEGSTSGTLRIFTAEIWETESEVTSLYRANSNDLYVHGTFASGTPEVNTFAPGDRVIIILSADNEATLDYKLDGMVFRVKAPDSGFMMLTPADTEITDIQMPGGLKLSSPRGTMVYKVGNDYVGDTADSDGDKVPDTWDVFPSDASESYDSDGDGLGDNSDSFPLDSTKTAPTNALVTPTNEISLYYTANDHAEGGKKDIYVHATGMPNLEVLSDGSYKVLGSYVKLVVTDSAITDASVKFDREVFKVTSASGQSNNQGYILHIEPASGASLTAFDSVRPASGTARWEYVNYMPNGLRLSLSGLSHVYDGNEKEVTVTTEPTGLNVGVTYTDSEGSAVANPTNAGTYTVTATIDDGNNSGSATETLTINKAEAGITVSGMSHTYDGSAKKVTVTTDPAGLSVVVTYTDSEGTAVSSPTNAGIYNVKASIDDGNNSGSATETLTINKAEAGITVSGTSQTYDGSAKTATATTEPAGLSVVVTYTDSEGTAVSSVTEIGEYTVVATVDDDNYHGSTSVTLSIGEGDPFGDPVTYTNIATTLVGQVTIDGKAAGEGDVVAIYVGEELRGKQAVNIDINGDYSAAGTAWLNAQVHAVGGEETAAIRVYEASTGITHDKVGLSVEIKPDGEAGTFAEPLLIQMDNVAPELTLLGEAQVTIDRLTTYADGGASATDNVDGDLTSKIVVTGAVDSSSAGTYTLKYDVSDAAGNAAESVSRTVMVEKTQAGITVSGTSQTYDGSAKKVTVITDPAGLNAVVTYTDLEGTAVDSPTNAGIYTVKATIDDANNEGSATETLTINKAEAEIIVSDTSVTFDGSEKKVTVTTNPSGLNVVVIYTDSEGTVVDSPTNVGIYTVKATIDDANNKGATTVTLIINNATVLQTLNLKAGWNLISFYVESEDMTPATVLASIKGNLVQVKDLKNSYSPTMPAFINTLKGLNVEAGYWLKVNAAVSFKLEGEVPAGASIPVRPGWNLVGYPRENKAPTADELTSIGDTVVQFKNLKDSYKPTLPAFINTLKVITPGLGYWLKVSEKGVWNVGDVSSDGANRGIVKLGPDDKGPGWGQVVVYPNVGATVLAEVFIIGEAVTDGSVVGAFMGDELRGEHEVVLADGRSYVAINVNLQEAEKVSFRIWDAGNDKEYGVTKSMTLEMGEMYGTAEEFVKLNGVASGSGSTLRIVVYEREPFGFGFESQTGSSYVVEATGDLKEWGTVKTYNGTGTMIRFVDERDQVFPRIYYRVKVVE